MPSTSQLPAYHNRTPVRVVSVKSDSPFDPLVQSSGGGLPMYGSRRVSPVRTVDAAADFAGFGGLGALDVKSMLLPLAAVGVIVFLMKRK